MTNVSELKYRPDIDGLRAIAVLSVVMFHAGVQSISGGFVGVDVFFVISGYLITSIIAKEIKQGDFSLITFYERRIRRILPAFFVVVFFSSIAGYLLLLPKEFGEYGESLIAAALSVSNILFWKDADYFDSAAELKPLLHTWSLGVEEQFYLLFPVFLLVINRFVGQRWVVWLSLVVIASFLASVWGAEHQPSATFYLAPTRAWELAVGAMLALGAIPAVHHRYLREIMTIFGGGLIVWGVVFLTPESIFPGINALFPCLGAVLIIHAGTSGQSFVGHFLSWRPLVLIGLISYSLYLWHWPLLVFAKYYAVRPLTDIETWAVVIMAFVAAIASWHFVERPFRKRKKMITRPTVFGGGSILTMLAVVFGLSVVNAKGLPDRIPDEAVTLANGASDFSATSRECMRKNISRSDGEAPCYIGAEQGEPSFIVLGDSHAGALIPGINLVAKKYGVKGIHAAMQSCPPLDGVYVIPGKFSQDCVRFRNSMISLIEASPSIQKVVLSARWPAYLEGTGYGMGDHDPKITLIDQINRSSGNHDVFLASMARTVTRLRQANKQVYLIFTVPEVGWNTPSISARNIWFGHSVDIRPKLVDFFHRNENVMAAVVMSVQQGVTVIYPHNALCINGYCSTSIDGRTLYTDDDHLSLFGAVSIGSIFNPIFDNKQGGLPNG